jgi:glycerate kinase
VHTLIAPNSFKNSVSALAAAHAIGRGLEQSRYQGSLGFCPVADGGDGTAALLTRHLGGATVSVQVHDPFGRPVHAGWWDGTLGGHRLVQRRDGADQVVERTRGGR